jgi:hypothetical protein
MEKGLSVRWAGTLALVVGLLLGGAAPEVHAQLEFSHRVYLHKIDTTDLYHQRNRWEVRDNQYNQVVAGPAAFTDKKVYGQLTFGIDHDKHEHLSEPVEYGVKVSVQWLDAQADTQFFATTLPLEYDPQKEAVTSDKTTYRWPGAHVVQVRIWKVVDKNGNQVPYKQLPFSLYLEGRVTVHRQYKYQYWQVPGNIQANMSASGRQIDLSWSPFSWADFYEVEWVEVDNYGTPYQPKDASELRYTFHRKAMRVRTKQDRFRLPNQFQRGYVIFRVRGVSKDPTNDQRPYKRGDWSLGDNYDRNKRRGDETVQDLLSQGYG